MGIRGLQKTTLLDYPGKVACTVFVSGCDFRCPYCYNRDLVLNLKGLKRLSEREFFEFLERRRGTLDAVVVCGGEPTLQPDLPQFLEKIKSLGLLTKLDTNGSNSPALCRVVEKDLVDYVALDVKAPLENKSYAAAVGLDPVDFEARFGVDTIIYSIEMLIRSGVDFELRTTVVPGIHNKGDLVRLAKQLRDIFLEGLYRPAEEKSSKEKSRQGKELNSGESPFAKALGGESAGLQSDRLDAVPWYLQSFEPRTCLDPSFDKVKPFSKGEMEEILAAVREIVPPVQLRGVI